MGHLAEYLGPGLVPAEKRLNDYRKLRELAPDADDEGPIYKAFDNALWAEIEVINALSPRNMAEVAVKLRLVLSDQGLGCDYFGGPGPAYPEEISLRQVLAFLESEEPTAAAGVVG